jgi:hypothetical protein
MLQVFYLERIFDREDQKKAPPVYGEAGGAGAELTWQELGKQALQEC